jgi:hypothetical protein
LSAVAAGTGPPLVILPGFGPGADLSVRVPRSAAWSTVALARGFPRLKPAIEAFLEDRPDNGATKAAGAKRCR